MELININTYPVSDVLEKLLKDKTTNKNIFFATDIYENVDSTIGEKTQISVPILKKFGSSVIQPRVLKSIEEQSERTRKKAEVFTPSWICNKMNNLCDEEWFGRSDVFNKEVKDTWETNLNKIEFNKPKDWQKYVDSKRLEITCGEAPFIVSRYDTSTGEIIQIKDRIGILDRKLRIVNENTENETDWLKWVYKSFQSVYGYEFQGDNLLIARINLLITFVDYMQEKWERTPTKEELEKITDIIVWNFWQMDGINGTIPFEKPNEEIKQLMLFDSNVTEQKEVDCIIFDWGKNEAIKYRNIKEGKK